MGKAMKRTKQVISVFLSVVLCVAFSFTSLADVASGSNAFLVPPASYGGAMPFSSVGSYENTVVYTGININVVYTDTLTDRTFNKWVPLSSDGSFHVSVSNTDYISQVAFYLYNKNIPSPGNYVFGFDFSSDFTMTVTNVALATVRDTDNASRIKDFMKLPFLTAHGDFYTEPKLIQLTSLTYFAPYFDIKGTSLHDVGGSVRFSFTPSSDSSGESTVGTNTSTQDYQNNVSNSISNISSSVGNMSSSLENAAESLDYISQSQNLIIKGIDNIILHISDQLYAFWDQLYNLIHVPTMAKLQEILEAIKNMNLNVDVDLDELKSAISRLQTSVVNQIASSTNTQINNDNKLSQEQINNDNQNTDTLANGYDNASMNADKDKLDAALSEYESAENQLFDDAKGHIKGFDFEDGLNEIVGPLTDISYFLSGIFTGIGSMNIAVSFSLTLSVALVFIGWYRFKGGG